MPTGNRVVGKRKYRVRTRERNRMHMGVILSFIDMDFYIKLQSEIVAIPDFNSQFELYAAVVKELFRPFRNSPDDEDRKDAQVVDEILPEKIAGAPKIVLQWLRYALASYLLFYQVRPEAALACRFFWNPIRTVFQGLKGLDKDQKESFDSILTKLPV